MKLLSSVLAFPSPIILLPYARLAGLGVLEFDEINVPTQVPCERPVSVQVVPDDPVDGTDGGIGLVWPVVGPGGCADCPDAKQQ